MKISRIEIKKYGPLSLKMPITPSDFNLFWGLNEKGKSLVIEAILSNLPVSTPTGDRSSWSKELRSIDENDVLIEVEEEKEIYNNKKGKMLKLNLSRVDIYNLFFVLNSNVMYDFEGKKDRELFQRALDTMSSTYIDTLKDVKKKLLEMNKLTEKLELKSTASDDYLGERYTKAQEVLKSIDDLMKKIEEEKYQEVELRVAEIKRELEEISKREGVMKSKRDERIMEKTSELMDMYYDLMNRADFYKMYDDEALEVFRNLYVELDKVKERIENLREKELKYLDERIAELSARLVEAGKVKSEMQRIEVTEKMLRDKLVEYKLAEQGYKSDLKRKKSLNILYIVSLALFFVSFFVTVRVKNPYLLFIPGALAVISIVSIWQFISVSQSIKNFLALKAEVFDRARILGLKSLEIEGLEAELDGIKNDLGEREKEFERIKAEKETIEKERRLKEAELKELEEKRIELETRIEFEAEKYRVEGLDDFEKKVEERRNLQSKAREYFKELEGLWHSTILEYQDENDFMSKVQDQLKKIRMQKIEGVAVEYNPQELENIEERKKALTEEKQELEGRIQWLYREYTKIQNVAEDVIKEGFFIDTFSDLIECKNRLEQFVNEQDENKKLTRFIVGAIEDEITVSQARLNDLFSDLTETSKIFESITDGRYRSVKYDEAKSSIVVEDAKGNILDIFKLSGGTIDQLFFSIRVGLGMKMLQGKKGFFVFDDPFVKSDGERLQRELDLLAKISEEGWQVLFFSCKDEVKSYLLDKYPQKINFFDLNMNSVLSHEV
ncbi:MAG TPA: AAA family ATPase [Candidatus Hydrothermia bacterium]|nr:AAA family ATPase [Candidatus Hydrothermia bacterium]HOL24257.1 AAA family ATPase [Candidatus Hydrothermia bacterium]HPO79172.1 AAA family ATPase [Candidatus Hydrothermia bacterium]